jgi:hemoglobin
MASRLQAVRPFCLALTLILGMSLLLYAAPSQEPGAERTQTGAESAPTADLDRQVYETLRTVINAGADLYNRDGDRAGCYRLFQGSLLTLRPLLAHHPELQKDIDSALAEAERLPTMSARAFALRKVMDEVRARVRPTAGIARQPEKPAQPEETKKAVPGRSELPSEKVPAGNQSLWQRLGGQEGVSRVVDDFVALAGPDPKVNFSRGGKFKLNDEQLAEFKQRMVQLISQVTGGPLKYAGKSMKESHKGMGITNAEFDAAVVDLRKAMEGRSVKPAEIQDLLRLVEGTRHDIVESPSPPGPKPEGKKTDEKKAGGTSN